ncbi:hypothetical protein [Candidatus Nitrosacidococcus sp. I8]|uniref:hypothetical protein n=1 Tax=Candidatus Nitrosacidococcus sp. I8 TaxID=2942908 RepID=UPI002227C8D7|nr:hypothetical protein [Candidatus Nitrosacidococcus sp. I8]CAH9018729.1 hypothetical protein NURINAE_01100 [Candidatus Nitrosacidococcus sp. I8]
MKKLNLLTSIFLLGLSINAQAQLAPENGWYVADQATDQFSGINIESQNNMLFVSKFKLDGTWTSGNGIFNNDTAQVQMVKTNPDHSSTPVDTDVYRWDSSSNLSVNGIRIHRFNYNYGPNKVYSLIGFWSTTYTPANLLVSTGGLVNLTKKDTLEGGEPIVAGTYIGTLRTSMVIIGPYPGVENLYLGMLGDSDTQFFVATLRGLNEMIGIISNSKGPLTAEEMANLSLSNGSMFLANRVSLNPSALNTASVKTASVKDEANSADLDNLTGELATSQNLITPEVANELLERLNAISDSNPQN